MRRATVFVEWNDHGVQRDSFSIDYSPTDLENWFKDDAELGGIVTQAEDELGVYLEDRSDEDGVGWLITEGGGAEEAAEILRRLREHMRSLRVPGA